MKTAPIPNTDSISELAKFWDTHDITDYEDQMELVDLHAELTREDAFQIHLDSKEASVVKGLAQSKGVNGSELIRTWVQEKIRAS